MTINRTGTSRTAREIPETVSAGILADAVEASAVLQLGNTFTMTAYQHRIRVLKAFADAFWLSGATQAVKDSARKTETDLSWDNVYITPDELAVLVRIDDAWMDDSDIAWSEIRKEVSRAFAKKIDQAIIFGDGSPPAGFSGPVGGLVGGANAAGNATIVGTTISNTVNDIVLDLATVAEDLAVDGYDTNGFVARKGFAWRLKKLRATTGEAVYAPMSEAGPATVFGQPFYEVGNGAWDDTEALALAGEWDKLVIGIKQNITFDLFDQAVLTDGAGNVTYSAVEQDGKVLRAVMRLGYAVPNPIKVLGGTFPFGILKPVGAS